MSSVCNIQKLSTHPNSDPFHSESVLFSQGNPSNPIPVSPLNEKLDQVVHIIKPKERPTVILVRASPA